MSNPIKKFFDMILDKVEWIIVYPDDKLSSPCSWSLAQEYAKKVNGTVKHQSDIKNKQKGA